MDLLGRPDVLGAAGDGRLIWPGFGVNWFGAGGNPNDDLAALSFSHQRLQYELSQIVPLAVIIVIGLAFYLLGGKTRQEPRSPAEPAVDARRSGRTIRPDRRP